MTADEAAVEAMAQAMFDARPAFMGSDPGSRRWTLDMCAPATQSYWRNNASAALSALLALDPLPPALVRAVLERDGLRKTLDLVRSQRDSIDAERIRLEGYLKKTRKEASDVAASAAKDLRAAQALAERLWPIVCEVAEANILNSDWPGHTRCGIPITVDLIRAAAALVREREEKTT